MMYSYQKGLRNIAKEWKGENSYGPQDLDTKQIWEKKKKKKRKIEGTGIVYNFFSA